MARFTQITHEHHIDTGIISRLNALVHDIFVQNSITLSMELLQVIFSTKNGVVVLAKPPALLGLRGTWKLQGALLQF